MYIINTLYNTYQIIYHVYYILRCIIYISFKIVHHIIFKQVPAGGREMELVQRNILYTYNIATGENKRIYSSGQTIRIFRLLYPGHSGRCSRRTRSLERPSMIGTSDDINGINDILALRIISAVPLARPHTAIVRLKNK